MGIMLLCGVFDKDAKISVVDSLLLALIGVVIVFVVLIVLMLVVSLMGKIFTSSEALKEKHPEWGDKINDFKNKLAFWKKSDSKEASAEIAPSAPLAEGTCGELKLINVEERDAAMIMAIVADSTGTPLNELRFKSIKKVEEDEK